MAVETDENGRLYLPAALRERYGDRFHVVEYENRIELIPIAEDPLATARAAAGDAFTDVTSRDVRSLALEEARDEALADLAPPDAGDSEEAE